MIVEINLCRGAGEDRLIDYSYRERFDAGFEKRGA